MAADPGIEALAGAFYGAFDNRGGKRLATAELAALFAPGATVTRVAAGDVETWSVEDFIAPRAALLSDGSLTDFHEWEVEASTTVFDNIASRCSRYRKQGLRDGATYAGAGRKFIQLCRCGERWLISSILWEDES